MEILPEFSLSDIKKFYKKNDQVSESVTYPKKSAAGGVFFFSAAVKRLAFP